MLLLTVWWYGLRGILPSCSWPVVNLYIRLSTSRLFIGVWNICLLLGFNRSVFQVQSKDYSRKLCVKCDYVRVMCIIPTSVAEFMRGYIEIVEPTSRSEEINWQAASYKL